MVNCITIPTIKIGSIGSKTAQKWLKWRVERLVNGQFSRLIQVNTCPHLCEYCYANASKDVAVRNWERAKETHWKSETITGK